MDNGIALFLTFIITTIFIIVVQVIFYRQRKRHAAEYSSLWERFDALKDSRNYEEIIELGTKLVYSTSLQQEHLKIIYATSIKHYQWHPEFETLKSNAYNKRLHWDRYFSPPY